MAVTDSGEQRTREPLSYAGENVKNRRNKQASENYNLPDSSPQSWCRTSRIRNAAKPI
jgi:hypothetical protein